MATAAWAEGIELPKHPAAAPGSATQSLMPRPIPGTCIKPVYPLRSIKAKESGTSVILLTVDPRGEVVDTEVLGPSGFARLDRAAAEAFRRCRFRPGRDSAGGIVQSSFRIRFEWRLEEAPKDPWVALRERGSGDPAATQDFSAVAMSGETTATPEQRSKMLRALVAEAIDKAQCPSIESLSVSPLRKSEDPERGTLELWTVKQCKQEMRYIAALFLVPLERASFYMTPLAPGEPLPF